MLAFFQNLYGIVYSIRISKKIVGINNLFQRFPRIFSYKIKILQISYFFYKPKEAFINGHRG